MNYKIMIRIHSWILLLASAFMAPALLISIVTSDRPAERGFTGAILITLAAAAVLRLVSRNAERKFYAREGLVCTGMAWIVLSLSGCLPFFLSGRKLPWK